ncbi:MAG: tRNA (N(6)-L-threonylcarbamoyladenosine(37)-C(2))-methylthiotransferase MtaB [Bacteroidota bacterium]
MNHGNKISFITLGCKLNFTESASLSELAQNNGFEKVKLTENPDIVVINTCSVTNNADSKCRQAIKKAIKNADSKPTIVITGCYAQLSPESFSAIEGVDIVLGNNEKFELIERLKNHTSNNAIIAVSDINKKSEFVSTYSLGDRTRSFLKIQDGCNYFCSYCTIPFARGRNRSDKISNVISNANKIAQSGIKEIILTGINIGHFGEEHQENLLSLLKELDKVEGISRYRLSSIEPNLISDEIIDFIAKSRKFFPHFHIPLQAGSNNVLKAMNRKYKRELFAERVAKIKSVMPFACIATDIIAGFPSESNEDFIDAISFIDSLNISYMHVFTYSERPNTKALDIKPIVPNSIRKERCNQLLELSDKLKLNFYKKNKDTEHYVLFESTNNHGFINGFTGNYIKVKYPFTKELINKIVKVKLLDIDEECTYTINLMN